MVSAPLMGHVVAIIDNGEACIEIGLGMRLLRQAAEDMPWREDLQQALEHFTAGIQGIVVKPAQGQTE